MTTELPPPPPAPRRQIDITRIQQLAIEAGFGKHEDGHLSARSDIESICSMGEYPCGDEVRQFAKLLLEEAARSIERLGDYCGGHGEPKAPSPAECAKVLRQLID